MSKIQVLDQITIDKIAAGEVIERPASVVKELVENALDAGSSSIAVEIKEGGVSFIRITDNGCGIDQEYIRSAFLRHSTSKIRAVEDLTTIRSLGFRGEALSSIAAVSQVELITKTNEDVHGTSYRISGGKEEGLEDIGAPEGTTFLIRQLFYNMPARRKFLKTPMTEASHVGELMTRLALSHPEVSFHFINNGQTKLHTSGNGNLKDVIYHVYGREVVVNILDIHATHPRITISGFIGKPLISRGNRNFENYFVNGRYVKSQIISKAIEDAYKDFNMQHKYPFVVLSLEMEGDEMDVNVHPTKMELRFNHHQEVYQAVYESVHTGLCNKELIPQVGVPEPPQTQARIEPTHTHTSTPHLLEEPIAKIVSADNKVPVEKETQDLSYFMKKMKQRVHTYHEKQPARDQDKTDTPTQDRICEAVVYETQLNLFEGELLTASVQAEYRLIGQLFETYWLVEYNGSLYIIDQHAAHERILYEKTLHSLKSREYTSQFISPPIILELSMHEATLLNRYMDQFTKIGFEIEAFGQESYAVRAVPDNLFSIAKKELLMEMLDSLTEELSRHHPSQLIDEKIASMSCKAAVKGKMKLSTEEVDALIGELLTLDNPYHCPHGRPTIIAMTKRELEKKFKRIV